MITKLLVFILVTILLVVSVSTMSCEKEKAAKLEMLRVTREKVGAAEQVVMECNTAVKKIEEEIASLNIQKKVTELRACKVRFDAKIDAYKAVYKDVNGRDATQAHIDALKRKLGIAGL
jgi:hypothetical protein